MKYYQQNLAKLAESMTEQEKKKIKTESKKFIEKHKYFARRPKLDFRLHVRRKEGNPLRNANLSRFLRYSTTK